MLNTAICMNGNFGPYGFPNPQPGTSSLLAVATGSLMQNAYSNLRNQSFRQDIPRGNKRERTKFDQRQLDYMEEFFSKKQYPDGAERDAIARALGLTDQKVQIWFKNRRAKDRNQKQLDALLNKTPGCPNGDGLTAQRNGVQTSELGGSRKRKYGSETSSNTTNDSPPPEPNQNQMLLPPPTNTFGLTPSNGDLLEEVKVKHEVSESTTSYSAPEWTDGPCSSDNKEFKFPGNATTTVVGSASGYGLNFSAAAAFPPTPGVNDCLGTQFWPTLPTTDSFSGWPTPYYPYYISNNYYAAPTAFPSHTPVVSQPNPTPGYMSELYTNPSYGPHLQHLKDMKFN